jgi:hypothetical protein
MPPMHQVLRKGAPWGSGIPRGSSNERAHSTRTPAPEECRWQATSCRHLSSVLPNTLPNYCMPSTLCTVRAIEHIKARLVDLVLMDVEATVTVLYAVCGECQEPRTDTDFVKALVELLGEGEIFARRPRRGEHELVIALSADERAKAMAQPLEAHFTCGVERHSRLQRAVNKAYNLPTHWSRFGDARKAAYAARIEEVDAILAAAAGVKSRRLPVEWEDYSDKPRGRAQGSRCGSTPSWCGVCPAILIGTFVVAIGAAGVAFTWSP